MTGSPDLASHLTGSWTLERTIELRHADDRAVVSGVVDWVPSDPAAPTVGLRYREAGTLTVNGSRLATSRELRFDFDDPVDHPFGAGVFFADGRPFYHLDLGQGPCRALHLCGPDRYQGRIELVGHDRMIEEWVVTGPTKDYTSRSLLTRRP